MVLCMQPFREQSCNKRDDVRIQAKDKELNPRQQESHVPNFVIAGLLVPVGSFTRVELFPLSCYNLQGICFVSDDSGTEDLSLFRVSIAHKGGPWRFRWSWLLLLDRQVS